MCVGGGKSRKKQENRNPTSSVAMEFSVAKPIMYFLALTVCPISVFFSFARQIALCNCSTCLMHVLPWRYSGRHSNSRGEETTQEGQACAVSLHPTDSPEDHVQLLTE